MLFISGIVSAMVLLASSTSWPAQALPGPEESTIVNVTPARIMDTRDPTNVGLPGPFVSPDSQKLKVTGSVASTTGPMTVVPTGATGVLLNVTTVNSTANGFISVRPGDATGAPTTSSLNFSAGAIMPNAVQVSMPTGGPHAGTIDISYDAYGTPGPTTDILVDVVGYTTNNGLQDLVDDLAGFVPHGDITLTHGTLQMVGFVTVPSVVTTAYNGVRVSGDGNVAESLVGPARLGTVDYGLRSIEYCILDPTGGASVSKVGLFSQSGAEGPPFHLVTEDVTTRTEAGCYEFTVNASGAHAYGFAVALQGGAAVRLTVAGMKSTWAPVGEISARLTGWPDASDPTSDWGS